MPAEETEEGNGRGSQTQCTVNMPTHNSATQHMNEILKKYVETLLRDTFVFCQ